MFYWLLRLGHTTALFWATHATHSVHSVHSLHHQSKDCNLTTALRQTSIGWLAGWLEGGLIYLPMAVIGVQPLMFDVVGLINLFYEFWPQTEQIGALGWFDRWVCSQSKSAVLTATETRCGTGIRWLPTGMFTGRGCEKRAAHADGETSCASGGAIPRSRSGSRT